ncbi:S24 family peptidase [Scandinavium manionii]|uniref:S24 family peptidase n=1 Tax=Scandinavium manionii TaxID=2926520 RepID=UPI00216643E0|nr:S24 family peptidase [Scandinavium manionii]MCS2168069.1 S24 family peptidase [Scandinavium manionii]
MQKVLNSINKPVTYPRELFVDDNGKYTPGKIMTCQMGGDSMKPTINPCELIAFADCGGQVSVPGVYVFTREVFGRSCVFVKRIEPMPDGTLLIISDNHHYETFTLDVDEQSDMQVYGRVIASMTMRKFV